MLNKIVSASIFAIVCSPAFANEAELALAPESADKCIRVYDKMYTLQEDLLNLDLQVSSRYTHFRVAQENYNKAFYRRNEIEARLATLNNDEPEFLVQSMLWNDVTETVQHWDEQRIVKLNEMQDVMYGRQLRTERLKHIRTTSLRCKGLKFDKKEVKEICSAKTDSKWCEGRF